MARGAVMVDVMAMTATANLRLLRCVALNRFELPQLRLIHRRTSVDATRVVSVQVR